MSKIRSLSTDLRRVAYFLQNGEIDLAAQFLQRDNRIYGSEQAFKKWLDKIDAQSDVLKKAEMAMTASVILASGV